MGGMHTGWALAPPGGCPWWPELCLLAWVWRLPPAPKPTWADGRDQAWTPQVSQADLLCSGGRGCDFSGLILPGVFCLLVCVRVL